MKNASKILLIAMLGLMVVGCNKVVGQGEIGRVKTTTGWSDNEALPPGHHTCWGRDDLFRADASERKYKETMKILVGGKVNLTVEVSVRCGINTSDKKEAAKVFDKVKANEDKFIEHKSLYETYVQTSILSSPKKEIGGKDTIESVLASRSEIEENVRQRIFDDVSSTPMKVSQIEITDWDWPDSLTKAQEELAGMQLEEQRREAENRAKLKDAEAKLKIAEADKLVELKKAETIAESIEIIKDKLKGSPEYLQWHTVRAMSEAAVGPNNTFLLFPYNMPGVDTSKLVANANLKQMLDKEPVPVPVPDKK